MHLVAAVLFRLHNLIDSGNGIAFESQIAMNAVTSFLAGVLEGANEFGDPKEWQSLARIWKSISEPPTSN
jgi:hypothetical protein